MTICQDIALPFHQIPVTPVPRWDKEKLAGLVLRGQESDRFIEDVQGELEGLVFGSNLSQPHLTAEEYWNQWSGAVRRAGQSFSAGNTQTSGKIRGHSCKAVVHSPLDPVALMGIRRVGVSAQYLPALFVLWRDLCILDCTQKVGCAHTSR